MAESVIAAGLDNHAGKQPAGCAAGDHREVGRALHRRAFRCREHRGEQCTAGDHGERPADTDEQQTDEHAETVLRIGVRGHLGTEEKDHAGGPDHQHDGQAVDEPADER